MKILHIISSFEQSGTNYQLLYLINEFKNKNHELIIIALKKTKNNSIKHKFDDSVKIYELENKNFIVLLKEILKLIRILNPEIIHTHTFKPDMLGAILLNKRYKVLSTIHSNSESFFKLTFGPILGEIYSKIHIFCLRKIKLKVSCSYEVQRIMKNKYKINTEVIQNGVPLERTEKPINISKNVINIIVIGSLTSLKNVEFIMNSLIETDLTFRYNLKFLGDGPLMNKMIKGKKNNIFFEGSVENVKEHLKNSNILISASKTEGLPMSIIEAMSEGKALLVSNINPHKEILKKNEYKNQIFELGNKKDFISKLEFIIKDNLYISIGDQNYLYYKKYFTATQMANAYERIYINYEKY